MNANGNESETPACTCHADAQPKAVAVRSRKKEPREVHWSQDPVQITAMIDDEADGLAQSLNAIEDVSRRFTPEQREAIGNNVSHLLDELLACFRDAGAMSQEQHDRLDAEFAVALDCFREDTISPRIGFALLKDGGLSPRTLGFELRETADAYLLTKTGQLLHGSAELVEYRDEEAEAPVAVA